MADQEENPTASQELLTREIKIGYYGTEDVIGIFADQAMVSHSTGLFSLLFFQMQIPPTEDSQELLKLETIPTRCVARIILTPVLMEQFYKAIQTNMEKHKLVLEQQRKNQES